MCTCSACSSLLPDAMCVCVRVCARACTCASRHVCMQECEHAVLPGSRVARPQRTKNHHDMEGGKSIPTMVTLAPSAARHLATAAPMPEEAPVTTTTLPSSLPMPVRLSVRAHRRQGGQSTDRREPGTSDGSTRRHNDKDMCTRVYKSVSLRGSCEIRTNSRTSDTTNRIAHSKHS